MYRLFLMNKLIMIRKYHQFYLKGRPNHVAPFDHWKLFQLVSACITVSILEPISTSHGISAWLQPGSL